MGDEEAMGGGIYGDFIDCVKTREKPFRDIEFAVNTVTVCHLGIVAYRVQRSLKWDAAGQQETEVLPAQHQRAALVGCDQRFDPYLVPKG